MQIGTGFAVGAPVEMPRPNAAGAFAATAATGTGGAAAQMPAVGAVDALGGQAQTADATAENTRLAEQRAQAKMMQDQFAQACQTCKNRKYQDGSDDPGVSFKTPQSIDPSIAASVVMGHEQEHVMHEQAKAKAEGGEVVSQTVVLHGDICPECGRYYIAGGTTRTVTKHEGHGTEGGQPGSQMDASV